jgi:hypothetical protein
MTMTMTYDDDPIPEPNLPLLRKALTQIELPGVWDQSTWMRTDQKSMCGTAGCIAGWAVELTGRYDLLLARVNEHDIHNTELYAEYAQDRETGEKEFIEEVARRELGLTEDEAEYLFDGNNGRHTLMTVAAAIAERAGEEL